MDWRGETAADLRDAESRLASVSQSIAGEPTPEQIRTTWRAYLSIEKSIAFIRAELDEENPGKFVKAGVYEVPDERQAVLFALGSLRRGREEFGYGNLVISLKHLRESRNYLRVLLREKRRRTPAGSRAD